MNEYFARFNQYIARYDDFLNAILVKDLRQTVRGKFFWIVFFLFITLVTILLFFTMNEVSRTGDGVGGFLSNAMLAFVYFLGSLIIPIYVGKKTANEFGDATHELLFITTMKPSSIVMGKFLSGAVTVLMLYAALAPFLALTLFMGGVDLRTLSSLLVFSFLFSNVAIMWQVFIGLTKLSIDTDTGNNFFNTSGGIVLHIILWFISFSFVSETLYRSSIRSSYSEFLTTCFVFLLLVFVAMVVLFSSSVSKLQPEASNSKYKFRILLTVIWVLGTIGSLFVEKEHLMAWGVGVFIILDCIFVFGVIGEPEDYSNRVIAEIPYSIIERIIKLPFFTGLANGFLWVVLLTLSTSVISNVIGVVKFPSYNKDIAEFIAMFSVFNLKIWSYCFLANTIRKLFFNRKTKFNVLLSIIIILCTSIGFSIVNGFMGYYDESFLAKTIAFLNPFSIFSYRYGHDNSTMDFFLSLFFLGFALLLNIRSLFKQYSNYFSRENELDKDAEFYRYMEQKKHELANKGKILN